MMVLCSRDGVYKERKCSSEKLDHGVLVVGYGIHHGLFSKEDYWTVKNRSAFS